MEAKTEPRHTGLRVLYTIALTGSTRTIGSIRMGTRWGDVLYGSRCRGSYDFYTVKSNGRVWVRQAHRR